MFFQIIIDQRLIKWNEQTKQQTTCFNFFKIMTFFRKNQYFFKVKRKETKFQ